MATITVRISDATRDKLQEKADEERVTLSDFVRDRLENSVFTFREETPVSGMNPQTMTPNERHMFALLHRILGRVLPEDANDVDGNEQYQLERAAVLEQGFTKEYWVEFAGLHPELPPRQCEFVMDVLDMFRIALYSINNLREQGEGVDEALQKSLQFRGFDHNDNLEGQLSDYVTYLINKDKWPEQKDFVLGDERGNSHLPMSSEYSRMLTTYRAVKQQRPHSFERTSYLLSESELRRIAGAHTRPADR